MIVEKARKLRHQIESLAENLDDEEALDVPELFQNWENNRLYAIGTRVRYDDILYKCLIEHTSQTGWEPVVAVSLWARVLIPDPGDIPEWIQPDSTNPYMSGDKVRHNNKIWISTIDNNVWEPGVYGWDEVI